MLGVLISCLCLTACYFHPRSLSSYPKSLQTIYLDSEKPYSALTVDLTSLMKSFNTVFVKKPSDTRLTVRITHDYFSYTRAEVLDTTLPSTMSFGQSATVSIIDNQTKKVLETKDFKTATSITLNANQLYTANSNDLIRQQLNRDIVSLIYYWLTSDDLINTINHATNPKTTRQASR